MKSDASLNESSLSKQSLVRLLFMAVESYLEWGASFMARLRNMQSSIG